jgi:hypothetical protein
VLRRLSLAAVAIVASGSAWSAGFLALRVTARSPFGRPFTDVGAAFWIALPFALVLPFTYLPLVWWTTHRISRGAMAKIAAAAIGGALLAVIPVGLGSVMYSGEARPSRELIVMGAAFHVVCGVVFCVVLTAILSTRWGSELDPWH